MMNKYVKQGLIAVVLTAALPAYQVFAQSNATLASAAQTANPSVTAIYNQLTAATSQQAQQAVIAQLIQQGTTDVATIISVAAAAGIDITTVQAAVQAASPATAAATVAAAYNNGLANITSFTPATAAGPAQQAQQTAQQGATSNGGFSTSSVASVSGGGGSGAASHN